MGIYKYASLLRLCSSMVNIVFKRRKCGERERERGERERDCMILF